MVFPELCLTGYTCGDLFQSGTLLAGAEQALRRLLQETEGLNLVAAVGLPVAVGGELYNCAAVLCRGRLLGLAAKSNIPNYGEFYEARHFSAAPGYLEVCFAGQRAPLGNSLLFRCEEMPELVLGVEICEDLWVPCPPDVRLTAGRDPDAQPLRKRRDCRQGRVPPRPGAGAVPRGRCAPMPMRMRARVSPARTWSSPGTM